MELVRTIPKRLAAKAGAPFPLEKPEITVHTCASSGSIWAATLQSKSRFGLGFAAATRQTLKPDILPCYLVILGNVVVFHGSKHVSTHDILHSDAALLFWQSFA